MKDNVSDSGLRRLHDFNIELESVFFLLLMCQIFQMF